MEMVYTKRRIGMREYLVTAQGYIKTDQDKQTILLHDSFMASDEHFAKQMFNEKFENDYDIINIYSVIDLSNS